MALGVPIITQGAALTSPKIAPGSCLRRSPRRGRGHLGWFELQNLSPEDRGYHDGCHNLHYLPTLDYRRPEDWLAWLRGWRTGQAELATERRAQGSLP